MKTDKSNDSNNLASEGIAEGIGKTKGFLNEFKKFALRGTVVDMAIGVVIGGAFGTIINSFVNNLVMPFVGMITSGQNFSDLAVHFGDGSTINYGLFIQAVVNFFVIALAVFIMVKLMNSVLRKKEAAEPTQLDVLVEIRDLLKEKDSQIADAIEEATVE